MLPAGTQILTGSQTLNNIQWSPLKEGALPESNEDTPKSVLKIRKYTKKILLNMGPSFHPFEITDDKILEESIIFPGPLPESVKINPEPKTYFRLTKNLLEDIEKDIKEGNEWMLYQYMLELVRNLVCNNEDIKEIIKETEEDIDEIGLSIQLLKKTEELEETFQKKGLGQNIVIPREVQVEATLNYIFDVFDKMY